MKTENDLQQRAIASGWGGARPGAGRPAKPGRFHSFRLTDEASAILARVSRETGKSYGDVVSALLRIADKKPNETTK